jgi:glucose-1-phosphate thymidylyltransferase
MKGIILAGGTGSRLFPSTLVTGKQLLPVFDKPMIYYPLSTLIHAGVNEVLIITTASEREKFENLLKTGKQFGLQIQYLVQESPKGVAQGLLLSEEFVGKNNFWFILGDNLFHGPNFGTQLRLLDQSSGALIFGYKVSNPQDYGILKFDKSKESVTKIIEKPKKFISDWAIPGLYKFDNKAFDICRTLKPSSRGELEITDVLSEYLKVNALQVNKVSRGNAWFDLGTSLALLQAANFVQLVQERQGLLIGSPEEAALNSGLISGNELESMIFQSQKSEYFSKLISLIS